MALNRNHSQNGGVLINNGESLLRECKNVELSFSDVTSKTELLKGTKKGTVYLTPYRMLFVSSNARDSLGSVMFPYYLMKGCSIEQPVFAANFIKGTISAEAGASRAPPAQNGGASFGYPSPGAMNGYGPPPQNYPYAPPPQQNGYYPAPPPPQGNMGYPYPTVAAGVYPTAPNAPVYMPPPPPYPGPPQNWTPPPPGNPKAAEAAGSAYYNPNNPHSVYMPMEQPPPYAPFPPNPDKKNN
ncbi:hypothetical protein JZ751_015266 [Albula glossodonta]|uniref:GRAM domain-containing protein n=1 Tax=Albula glossodonta TaxID=121402 RepID=A0A8T2P068_9TELE|nr:hypothetical protein JZ751_015266 [Albula glossodonta]